MYNQNSGYGASLLASVPFTTGKVFVLAKGGVGNNYERLSQVFKPDPEGVQRIYTSIDSVTANCVAGRGDMIIIDESFDESFTGAQLTALAAKGVKIHSSKALPSGLMFVETGSLTLPASKSGVLFRVVGNVFLRSIVGFVTTVASATATTLKLSGKKGATTTDMCGATAIANAAVGTKFSITGTVADNLVKTDANKLFVAQAGALYIEDGSEIIWTTSATNTGKVRWEVVYEAVSPNAGILLA